MTTIQLTEDQLGTIQSAMGDSATYWYNLLMGTYDGSVSHVSTKGAELVYQERLQMIEILNSLSD